MTFAQSMALWLATGAVAAGADLLRYTVRAQPFEVELTLPDGSTQKKALPRQPTHFYHRVNIRWPVPEGPADRPVRCEIRWEGLPAHWRLASSFGIDQRLETVDTTLGKWRKAVFAGGSDLRISTSPKGLWLVTRGAFGLPDTAIMDLMDRVAGAHTAVWRDHGVPGHRFFVMPSGGDWGGEGRTHALIMEGRPDAFERSQFARLMAHELFHEWNPRRENFDDNEELYWFTEGFTDYYAVMAMWRTRTWTFSQVLDDFNTVARRYYASPVRNFKPAQMVAQRQSNPDVNRLPYLQGYLLAFHWNARGMRIDQAMRNLLTTNQKPLSNDRIAKAMKSIGSARAREEIRRFIEQGETIELRRGRFGACATETQVEAGHFDLGFDWEASKRAGILVSVKENSNAWIAGARDGMKWEGRDIAFGDSAYRASIAIERDGKMTVVSFLPASRQTVTAPQYRPVAAGCDPQTWKPVR